jgi:predicted alpha/beta hydrolase family esterase
MKVYLIHGWEGSPDNHWFPWLMLELGKKKIEVEALAMPHSEKPTIEDWVAHMKEIVKPDKETILVGHSIGCQTIMRYLESLDDKIKIKAVIFVAGFFNLPYLKTKEEKIIAKPWLETKIDTDKVRKKAEKFVAVFSDNDPDVDLSDSKLFKERLNAEIIVEHEKGHFTNEVGVDTLPVVLNKILALK